jgi:outer membrane protein
MRSFVSATFFFLVLTSSLATTVGAQASATPASGQNAGKIAYIRSPDILAVAPGRAEAEAQFQKEMSGYRTEVQRMGDTISTMIADYQKQEATLSPTAKQTKQKEIRDKEDSYQKRTQELEQTAQQRQNELVRPIMEQINKLIEQVRAEDGYAYVLDAGSAAGVVVAADKSLDITDKVIQRLKAAGPIAATPTPTVADTAKKPGVKSPPTSKPAGVSRPKSTTPPGAL